MTDIFCKEVIRCTNFAAVKHSFQRRKDPEKTPYINHPIGVAYILTSEGDVTDLAVIQAALLHDTVEDTDTSFEEIEQHFGKEVCDIVREVTDDKMLPKHKRKQLQISHTPHISNKAKLVKLADKLYNVRDLHRKIPQGWDEARAQEYYRWARDVVRGITGVNDKLEQVLHDFLVSVIK